MDEKGDVKMALKIFLHRVLSDVAPGLVMMLESHVRLKLGKDLATSVIEEPNKVYEVLSKVMSEETLRILDKAIARYVFNKYHVRVDDSLLTELNKGSNKNLIRAALKLYGRVS
ncbi:MAG: hypothetical protein B6U85_06025 [Desulfurococcales archaeon ex4484_42]|nr:MAG: hypothetical protein B6U85_06025 [Desulfurococcales archaeon ex4484_42]